MITTLSEVKTRLGITGTDFDTRISALLDEVEFEFLKETKNMFFNPLVKYQSSTLVFSASKTISDIYADFIDDYFIAGWVYVTGSVHNNGWHQVSELTETTLTTVNTPVAEESGEFITIQLAKFPTELKSIIADMMGERIAKDPTEYGLTSESLGSHSKSFVVDGYSKGLQKRINNYRNLYA